MIHTARGVLGRFTWVAVAGACAACSSSGSSSGDGASASTLTFAPVVGTETFACGTTYSGVGRSKTSFQPLDFRLYVSNVALVSADGTEVPFVLDEDGRWQSGKVALLDFEDGSGACSGGTQGTNFVLRGTAPSGSYTGVAFNVGVPEAENHIDSSSASPPMNTPGMFWSWKDGARFVRLDVKTPKNNAYVFHLGASQCSGSVTSGFSCAAGNYPRIVLSNFDLAQGKIAIDVAALWAGVDLDTQVDEQTDLIAGCEASPDDPECPPVLTAIGLKADGSDLNTQSVFRGM